MDVAVVNGVLGPLAEARVSVLDLGFMRGCGAFETLATFGGHPHAVRAHLDRLERACAELGFPCPFAEKDFRAWVREMLAASNYADLRVNIVATPGNLTGGVFDAGRPNWVIIGKELVPPPAECYRDGIAIVSFRGRRVLPSIKATTYITGLQGLTAAQKAGAHEACYVDEDGRFLEGVTSNLHVLHGREVRSPVGGCLGGLTREAVRRIAEREGLRWLDADVHREDFADADEVWITSSVRELLPVVRVDDLTIGDGRPGPWARKLYRLHHAACLEEAARDAVAAGMVSGS